MVSSLFNLVCMFLNVFDEHDSFADQRHVSYGFLSVVIHNSFAISFEIDLPPFFYSSKYGLVSSVLR